MPCEHLELFISDSNMAGKYHLSPDEHDKRHQMHPIRLKVHHIRLRAHRIRLMAHRIRLRVHRIRLRVHRIRLRVHRIRLRVHHIRLRVHRKRLRAHRIRLKVYRINCRKTCSKRRPLRESERKNAAVPGGWSLFAAESWNRCNQQPPKCQSLRRLSFFVKRVLQSSRCYQAVTHDPSPVRRERSVR
jgi:hypothetical protein